MSKVIRKIWGCIVQYFTLSAPLSSIGKLSSNQKHPTLYYLRFLAIQVISLFYNKWSRAPCDRAILELLNFALWLVQKARAFFLINQKSSRLLLNQSNLKLKPIVPWDSRVFPRFRKFACFTFILIGSLVIFSVL